MEHHPPRPQATTTLLGPFLLVALLLAGCGNDTPPASTPPGERYSYDAAGRLTGVTYPDGTSIRYHYDANGNREQRVVRSPQAR